MKGEDGIKCLFVFFLLFFFVCVVFLNSFFRYNNCQVSILIKAKYYDTDTLSFPKRLNEEIGDL